MAKPVAFSQNIQGFTQVGLRTSSVEIGIIPALGAKITTLRDLRSGREWMWSPPEGRPLTRVPTGTPFDQGPIVGADECFPTIGPCTWRGRDLPDHGEVWTEAWTLDESAMTNGELSTGIFLPYSPFRLQRTIRLRENICYVDYSATNTDVQAQEFVWAFHPLLSIQDGDCVTISGASNRCLTEVAIGVPLGSRGDSWFWPEPKPGINLAQLALGGAGRALKFFTERLPAGVATVHNERTGDSLHFAFDDGVVDTFGVWINRGGWNGYEHLAIEPGIGAPDPLDIAATGWKRARVLMAGSTVTWQFRLTLGSPSRNSV